MDIFGKSISAAIFDMDGTMLDTERLRLTMLKQASTELHGQSMSDELLMDSLGLSAQRAEALAKACYGAAYPYAQIRERADALELDYVRQQGVPVKNALIDVLERLKKNGILLAVATSSRRAIALEYLQQANLSKYFDVVVCGDEVCQGKPDPEIFLTAAERLTCPPEQCLMFEDSQNGLRAALAAGGQAVYVKDIKDPELRYRQQALFACQDLDAFLRALIPLTRRYPMPRINERFPQSHNQLSVGIHGFGAIGGGYLSQVLANWDGYTRPARIIGVTGNALLRNLVNAFGQFTVNYERLAFEQTIKNVELIDAADETAVIAMYRSCPLVALCLPEPAIRQQADLLARALLSRQAVAAGPLTLLIVLNKVRAGQYVRQQILEALLRRVGQAEAMAVLAGVHFCETVVNRMVSRLPKRALLTQIQSGLTRLDGIPALDLTALAGQPATEAKPLSLQAIAGLLGDLSSIQQRLARLNLVLFNSEPDMALYVSDQSPLLARLRQVKVVEDIAGLQMIKNRLSNGTHAILAWFGGLLGHQTIGQAMGDERVQRLVDRLMREEIQPLLLARWPQHADYMADFIPAFVQRCRLSFKDPCDRVGRDPIRKLQHGERVLGTLTLAQEQGLASPMLELGLAAGLLWALEAVAPADEEGRQLRQWYAEEGSLERLLTHDWRLAGKPVRFVGPGQEALLDRLTALLAEYEQQPEQFFARPLVAAQQAAKPARVKVARRQVTTQQTRAALIP
ncbi:HAD-IA family hydrolase [Pseudaeromonas sp. ZJS20]|uniref:bifunctional mannitol-1-phosphate dehydrogenase/phosphatase n=1 Tax=Pseudaeromonas aegiceratis TaxID=3153928 RepID=UPI00390C9606